MAACRRNYVFEDGHIICKTPKDIARVFEFDEAIQEMNTFELFDMSAWAKIYDRELFETIRFPEGKLSEDYFVMFKLIDLAHRVAYISEHLQITSSISRNKKINHDFIGAAKAQMEYLDQRYPELKIISHTAYASANLTVYDFYLKNGVKCSKENIADFKKAVRENRKYIDGADFMRRSKKIQFQLFLMNTTMYDIVFRMYRKIKRV